MRKKGIISFALLLVVNLVLSLIFIPIKQHTAYCGADSENLRHSVLLGSNYDDAVQQAKDKGEQIAREDALNGVARNCMPKTYGLYVI